MIKTNDRMTIRQITGEKNTQKFLEIEHYTLILSRKECTFPSIYFDPHGDSIVIGLWQESNHQCCNIMSEIMLDNCVLITVATKHLKAKQNC